MRKILTLFFVLIFGVSYGDDLLVYKNRPATYIQYEEFLVAEGTSVLGPVKLKPLAITDSLRVEANENNIQIQGILINKAEKNWRETIIGKNISIEGGGRFVKGKVKGIDGKYIILDTKRGTVITTLPDFPEKISSILRWEELFSPYIMIKIKSNFSGNSTFRIFYQLNDINWNMKYVLDLSKRRLTAFLVLKNNTNVNFQNVNLLVQQNSGKTFKRFKTSIDANSYKLINIGEFTVSNGKVHSSEKLPNGNVYVYSNYKFEGVKKLINLTIR